MSFTEAGHFAVVPIGWVESELVDRSQAPRQPDEGAPSAWLVFESSVAEGIRDLRVGDHVIVLTWLDRARRDVLSTIPRDDPDRPVTGVFSTRSPDRPNPIGLHRAEILAINGLRIQVDRLEALNRTPIVDIKPVLDQVTERQSSPLSPVTLTVMLSRPFRPSPGCAVPGVTFGTP